MPYTRYLVAHLVMASVCATGGGCRPAALDGDLHPLKHTTFAHQVVIREAIQRLEQAGVALRRDLTCKMILEEALSRHLLPSEGIEKMNAYNDGWGREMFIVYAGRKRVVRSFGQDGQDQGGSGDDIDTTIDNVAKQKM